MACGNSHAAFSPDADLFAHSSADGCLKIWEICSNVLKQEFTPSAHLSSTCSSISWDPCKQIDDSPKKKLKRAKSWNAVSNIANLKLIAMGTLSGDVLLYSVSNGNLYTKLSNGHSDVVNCVSWLTEEDALFTCSSDQYIIKWSISEGTVSSKWKAGKLPIYCVCVVDSKSLLSADSSITWWDIKTQKALKTFIGHGTEVASMMPVLLSGNSMDSQYFVSSASNDRVVNVWLLSENSDESAIASFALSDEPSGLDISRSNSKAQPIILSAVTKSGFLHIFEHQLNGKVKKPVKPKSTVHIASSADNSEKSHPIPILAAKVDKNLGSCCIAYGNFLKPVFEKLDFESLDRESYLIRNSQISVPSTFESVSKIKEPERSSSTKLLAPGYMTPAKPTEGVSRKKKRKAGTGNEMPMEERLNAMHLSQAPESQEAVSDPKPSSESMVHLLLQGLQSKDNKLLHTVLRCSDETLITNTVKRLPLHSVPILLKELHGRLSRKEQGNRPCLRWLRDILAIHLSYLMSLQEIDEYIGPVSQLIDAREETFSKMLQLKGFLDILWSQIDSRTQQNLSIPTEPLNTYEDESSSEEEADLEEDDEMDLEHSEIASEHEEFSESESEEEKDKGLLSATDDELDNS